MTRGIVTEIERYVVHDGPGIRTIVYFKGCPLRCRWCSNPETQKQEPELYYNPSSCKSSHKCVEECPEDAIKIDEENERVITDRDQCTVCGDCVEICPSRSRRIIGEYYTPEEIFEIVKKDTAYYRESGGGITLSGGEVLQQPEFAASILKKCKEEYIHTTIETSGYGEFAAFEKVIDYTDLMLFDIKHMDGEEHIKLTGKDNDLILENLRQLRQEYDQEIILRIPLISGVNDSEKNITKLRDLALELSIEDIHFLPYHSMGKINYIKLEREYPGEDYERPSEEHLEFLKSILTESGIDVNIGGSE